MNGSERGMGSMSGEKTLLKRETPTGCILAE